MNDYDHKKIEKKWQKEWEKKGIYKVENKGKDNFYTLVEFPYPSGNLHIGHWYAFAVPDIYARYMRMNGKNVLFPIGFDSFGLPAENAAIKRSLDPRKWTDGNIEYMRNQMKSMGASFDWSRELITSDPKYYKWTQYIFTKMFEKGLAYRAESTVNWCLSCMTVLANEQVVNGLCERCDSKVIKKKQEQWMLKITDYTEDLLEGLDNLDWPDEIKESQRNWIGRSRGTQLEFSIGEHNVSVFTTRPDTIYGVTYIVLAPEYPLMDKLEIENRDEVERYIKEALSKSELERQTGGKEKAGVKLGGVFAKNPISGEEVPVYVSDYVLSSYGTGAVMAVPAHDERDFEFAKKFGLPVKEVIIPERIDKRNPPVPGKEKVERQNVHVIIRDLKNDKYLLLKWKKFDWLTFPMGGVEDGEDVIEAAKREVYEETGYKNLVNGKVLGGQVRAEYFAAHKDENRVSYTNVVTFDLENEDKDEIDPEEAEKHDIFWAPKSELTLDKMTHAEMDVWLDRIERGEGSYTGDGIMINSGEYNGMKNIEVEIPGEKITTYRLRDWSVGRQRYWGTPIPIVYDPEGVPHVVPEENLPWELPSDVDFKPTGEPPLAKSKELQKRVEDIFGEGWIPEVETMDTFIDSSWYFLRYIDPENDKEISSLEAQKDWMPVGQYFGGSEHTTMHLLFARFLQRVLYDLGLVTEKEPFKKRLNRGLIMGPDGSKMSKSKGNVVDPDEVVDRVGADTVRTYLAFIGPYAEVGSYPWDMGGIAGVRRFLERVNSMKITESGDGIESLLHKTIKKVTDDCVSFKFNTAVSSMMIFVSSAIKDGIGKEDYQTFLKVIAPFAPHLADELWKKSGMRESIHLSDWPEYNESVVVEEEKEIVVQIDGKVRGSVRVLGDISEKDLENRVLEDKEISKWIEGGYEVKKVVPGRLISLISKSA